MTILRTFIACLMFILAMPAQAGPSGDALRQCLADNTTGKDRKALAKWVFLAMAAHPEMQALSHITDADRDDSAKTIAALITHLLTESCPTQLRDVVKSEGNSALPGAFQSLGALAMQELMVDPAVKSVFAAPERYLDRARIEAVIHPK